MDQIRSVLRQLIVHTPRACNPTRTTLRRRLQTKQRHDITRVCVKDLSVGGISRTANHTVLLSGAEVLDVAEDNVGGVAVEFTVLTTPLPRDVCGDANVDGDVLFARVLVHVYPADDEESVAFVEFIG
ncbi:hypothetical protein HG530_003882 [Fusarium avenaceum]|nr:hypothetical protein HG530_003882 [Fusarium avenaceum]